VGGFSLLSLKGGERRYMSHDRQTRASHHLYFPSSAEYRYVLTTVHWNIALRTYVPYTDRPT
jgi:hypothetical protein